MNIDDCYPSKYLKASDIGDGREVTVVIVRVQVAQLKGDDGQAETKPIVYFAGKEKGMLLNLVNKNAIKKLYGSETDNWIGKPIRIGTSWVDAFGDQALALRVRPVMPAPPQRANGPVPAPVPVNAREPVPARRNGKWQAPSPAIPEPDHGDAWEGQDGDSEGPPY